MDNKEYPLQVAIILIFLTLITLCHRDPAPNLVRRAGNTDCGATVKLRATSLLSKADNADPSDKSKGDYMKAKRFLFALIIQCNVLQVADASAQTATNLTVAKGLAQLSVLQNSVEGKAALASNFSVTGGIQTGDIRQPTLLPFEDQQQQALRDAFITDGNLSELADGLGTVLGSSYVARAHYIDRQHFTSIAQSVVDLIAYTNATTREILALQSSSSRTELRMGKPLLPRQL